MGKTSCRFLQRLHHVLQHPVVDCDLLLVAPTGNKARALVERGVDDVRHVPEGAEDLGTRTRIGEIRSDKPGPKHLVWAPAGNGDHLAGGIARKCFIAA